MGLFDALRAAAGMKALLDEYGLANTYNKYTVSDILFGKLEERLEPFELDGELFVIPPDQIQFSGARRDAVVDPPDRDGSVCIDLGRPSIPITVSFIRFSTFPSFPGAPDARDWREDLALYNQNLRQPPGSPGSWAQPVEVRSPTLAALGIFMVKIRRLEGVVSPNKNPNLLGLRMELLETDGRPLFLSDP